MINSKVSLMGSKYGRVDNVKMIKNLKVIIMEIIMILVCLINTRSRI